MTTEMLPTADPSAAGHRRGLIGACAGNAVEWYDFALFIGSTTVFTAVLTPGGWAGFTAVFAVFATACLFRPLGSLIVGARADRTGRQPMLAVTIGLMSLATFAIGLLPPWAVIGLAAPLCLLGLRAAQAFSAGGEIGVSVAYLTEVSPAGRRGRYGGWYLSTVAIGLALGLGATALVAALLDQQAWQSWGWRIPFLLALPLGLVGVYLRRRLAESPTFVRLPVQHRVRPRTVLREHLPTVRRCFLLGGAYSAAFNVWFLFLPSYVTATGATSLGAALSCAMVGLVVGGVAAPLFGRLSDRVGRRPVLLVAAGVLALAVMPLYGWALGGSMTALLVGDVTIGLVMAAFVLPAFLAEQFPVRVRATGIGLAYGISSAVIGGTAPLLATVMSRQLPVMAVPGYLALWAVIALLAVRFSPETVARRVGTARQTVAEFPPPTAAH